MRECNEQGRRPKSQRPLPCGGLAQRACEPYLGIGPFKSHTPVTPLRSTMGRLCEMSHPPLVRWKSVRYSPVMVTDAAPVVSFVLTPSHAAVMVAVSPSTLIGRLVTM